MIRIAGVGRLDAGDDAVGLEVVRELRRGSLPRDVEIREIGEPSLLAPLFDGARRLVVVDGLATTSEPGEIRDLDPDDLARPVMGFLSTHGIGVADALSLGRELHPGFPRDGLYVVAVTIRPPDRWGAAMSPRVAAAVPRAAARVLEIVRAGEA